MNSYSADGATIWNTEQHVLVAGSNRKSYLVQVALPHGYKNSSERFDVIYAPDANMTFGMYASLTQALPIVGEGRPVIFVAVGYPADEIGAAVNDRQDDLMPEAEPVPAEMRELSARASVGGGAESFREFLTGQLRVFVDAHYRTKKAAPTLFGHSTGGSFALDTLFKATGSFENYLVLSPWLSMAGGIGLRLEAEYAATHDDLEARLFLAAGALEDSQELIRSMRIAHDTRALGEALAERKYPSLDVHTREFEDEGHVSCLARGLAHGFRYIFGPGSPEDRSLAFPGA